MVLKKMRNLSLSSKDFSLRETDAVIWGVFLGWDEPSYIELQGKFNWSDHDIVKIKQLREFYRILSEK